MKGRAVIYATTLDSSPTEVDFKAQYISEPVVKGQKIVANVHVHEFNFVKAEAWRCFEPRAPPPPPPSPTDPKQQGQMTATGQQQQQQQQQQGASQQQQQQQEQQRVQQIIPGQGVASASS